MHQTLDRIICTNLKFAYSYFEKSTTEHAGERGEQISNSAETEAYGDKTYVTNFAASLRRSQAANTTIKHSGTIGKVILVLLGECYYI